MTRGSPIGFCSNPRGRFASMDNTTGRSKSFAMVIRLTLNPRTKTRRLCRIFLSPSVIIGEVKNLVCSSRAVEVLCASLRQLFIIGTCVIAFSISIDMVDDVELLSRLTFQESDGVTLSFIDTFGDRV